MKFHLIFFSLLITAIPCSAEYRAWTNSEGQTAELELYDITERDGEKAGRFRMKNGKSVVLKSSQLSPEDAKILEVWGPSVFGEALDGNLVVLKDGRFQDVRDHSTPNKYYLFYYTAYWCPPCRAFTPSLVKWYEQNKNANFELVLISRDNEKSDMLAYAKDKKMPWPHVKFSKSRSFQKAHDHRIRSIPTLIVCDLKGKVLGDYRHNLDALSKMVK